MIPERYHVGVLTQNETYEWLLKIHYAHRIPSISYAFGLFNIENKLVGVCTFGCPPSNNLCVGICGEEYASLVIELNRLVMIEKHEKNLTSYFVSKILNMLPSPKIVVSYADTSVNHIGYIYIKQQILYILDCQQKDVIVQLKGLNTYILNPFGMDTH